MNQKTTRRYELIAQIVTGGANVQTLGELLQIDFVTAFDMWEYALAKYPEANLAATGFDLFMNASESKMRANFGENTALQKLVYGSPAASSPNLINYLAMLIMQNKLEIAGECLAKMKTNSYIDFHDALRVIVEKIFALSCEKNGTVVPVLNKKQKTLLLEYINKIKNPNKSLLMQRMKEIA